MIKKTYQFNEISCANCAQKIEDRINDLPKVDKAYLNFMTKEIKVEFDESVNSQELFNTIQKLITEIEQGVTICEVNKKEIECGITGLDCESCARKIEDTLNQTEGIMGVSVNMMSSKLKFIVQEGYNKEEVFNKAQKIVDKIEPGVILTRDEKVDQEENTYKLTVFKIVFSIILFATGILLGDESIYYIPAFLISYLVIGGEIVYKAIRNIMNRNWFDENFLMTIATIGAFGIREYPEAVAVMLFYQVGEFFQEIAVNRSRKSIKSLMEIKPDRATVKEGEQLIVKQVDEVHVDDIIVVKPGERIPLDATIIEGESSLDTKALTGESLPVNVASGDKILSGCINLDGYITARVTKLASESTVSKILELVQNASSKKAPTEKFITKFARYYTPIVTVSALLLAIIPPLVIQGATYEEWLYRAFIFLVISCPCALVISIPLGFFGGIGAASKQGILIKGGNYLEALNKIDIAVFDKTGTLTKGSFKVFEINPIGQITSEELLETAAHIEHFSNHPIAISVIEEFGKAIDSNSVKNINEIPGHGLTADYHGKKVVVGNNKLMVKEQINYTEYETLGSILYVAVDGQYLGNIVVADEIKEDSKATIAALKKLGVKKTVMLTGDKKEVAEFVGQKVGIDEIHAELLPDGKLAIIEKLIEEKNGNLFFVGDGINDTPVLARADVGIAMGGLGSDAAIEVSDMVIMNDETGKIVSAIKIAKNTRKIVWQNIIFALGVKVFFLALGTVGMATMWEAVFADVGVSVLAILNSFRVLRTKV